MEEDFRVTPWEVSGRVDYDRIIQEFGTTKIDESLKERIKKNFGELHQYIRRDIFFSHRDLDIILSDFENGKNFYLYTGRGPSGHTHLGHILPWIFTKYLQEKTGSTLLFQLTDDEKFYFKEELSLEDTKKMAYENILDIIALGFSPEKTKIFLDTEYIKTLYPVAAKVAKKITFSTARAVFGLENSNNLGEIFYTSLQSAPAFLPTEFEGKITHVLIPCGIDQDPHFRVCRDVAPKLGYPKPALLHCKLFPSLMGAETKMSASVPETSIFTTDAPKVAKKKIMSAFTGGAVSVEEQRKHGGNPEVCSVFAYYQFMFEPYDEKLTERYTACRNGNVLCGECKQVLAERVVEFLKAHQERRERAREFVEKFIVRD
ncbi:MAG: tryptophan--tRNA ligase [Thermoplasmata archaeon]